MLRDHVLVLDDYIPKEEGNTTLFSSSELDEVLGRYDEIALFVALDNCADSFNTLYVQLFHSGDGFNFVPKATAPELELTWASIPTSILTGWGSDPNAYTNPAIPSARYVRVGVSTSEATLGLHVKVYASLRDLAAPHPAGRKK